MENLNLLTIVVVKVKMNQLVLKINTKKIEEQNLL